MPVTARIHSISKEAYLAAHDGNQSRFQLSATDDVLDLDWNWHEIHFLLTGDSTLTFLLSGSQVTDVSEHCQVHSPEAIRDVFLRLKAIPDEDFMARFNPTAFNALNIYPGNGNWSATNAASIATALRKFLNKLQQTVDSDQGLMVVIC